MPVIAKPISLKLEYLNQNRIFNPKKSNRIYPGETTVSLAKINQSNILGKKKLYFNLILKRKL